MSEERTLEEFAGEGTTDDIGETDVTSSHPRLGSLPPEWEVKEIADIAEVVGGSTPSTDNEAYWGGEIQWATPTDITGLSSTRIEQTADTLTQEGLESASTHLLPPSSVLITSRATIGKCAVNTVEMATNQGFKSLVPKEDVETWYLYYRMLETGSFLDSLGAGSTFDEVSKSEVESVDIPIPPLEEQRKIASVLYNIDQAIQKTEKIVDKTERVLRGVTNEILIAGIDEQDHERERIYSFRFQKPTSWEVVELQEINRNSKPICYGIVQPGKHHEDGVPILNIENAKRQQGIDVQDLHRVSPELHDKFSRSVLEGGEIVISVKGSTGDIGRVPTDIGEWNISRDLARISPKDEIDPNWLRLYLSTDLAQKFIHVNSPGSTRDSLNIGDLKELSILLPPADTQSEIAETVGRIEEKLDWEIRYHRRLRRLKHGLMQDLLSGEVRTTDADIKVLDEVLAHG